jgi:hypothetical protein
LIIYGLSTGYLEEGEVESEEVIRTVQQTRFRRDNGMGESICSARPRAPGSHEMAIERG